MGYAHELKATTDGMHRDICGTKHRTLEAATACIVRRYGLLYELGEVVADPFTHDAWEVIPETRDTLRNPAIGIRFE